MPLIQNSQSAKFGFIFANFILIFIMYHRFEDVRAFLLCAAGLIVISTTLRRVVYKLTGV